MSARILNHADPEDSIWISCPECDVLPGDPCILDPELASTPGFDKAVHFARIKAMTHLAELESTT